jgi:hypothetical protein
VAVGMTTCPRDGVSYIQESINSLVDNGWDVPLVYNDQEKRGDWWGFIQVCRLLLIAYPTADKFLVLQDDAIACGPPRDFLEVLETRNDVMSLFTMHQRLKESSELEGPAAYLMSLDTGLERMVNCNGGIAYLINRKFAAKIIDRAYTVWTPTPQMIGNYCHSEGIGYWIAKENAFEHIGEQTSLHPDKPGYRWDVSRAAKHRKETK